MTVTPEERTAVAPAAAARSAAGDAPAAPRAPWSLRSIPSMVFDVFASMKTTVVILLLFGLLTWAGTLAQKSLGLFVVQRDFFESFFVRWDTGVSLGGDLVLKVPLPGGYLLMLSLFANLLVGGIVRLKLRWRNLGVLIAHFGMGLLLVAGFVKLHWSFAGHVALFEGSATSSMVSFHDFELALLRRQGEDYTERVVSAEALQRAAGGQVVAIDDPNLPFTLTFDHWLENCEPTQKGPMFDAPTPVVTDARGTGVFLAPRALAKEREQNQSGCYVTVEDRASGKQQRGILWGADFRPYEERRAPFTFVAGGQTYGLDLRRVTWDLPFAVRLDRFQKTDHPGTPTPADFSSWVTVQADGRDTPFHIYMNHPLRRDGYVFFQTNWGPQPGPDGRKRGPPWYSVFEVAKNPSDLWPELASYVILAGLVLHFLTKLVRYLHSSQHKASAAETT